MPPLHIFLKIYAFGINCLQHLNGNWIQLFHRQARWELARNCVLRVTEFIVHRQLLSHLQGPLVPWQITQACLQKEREKTQGTRLVVSSSPTFCWMTWIEFFTARRNVSKAMRLLLGMVRMSWKCTFIHLNWYSRDSFTVSSHWTPCCTKTTWSFLVLNEWIVYLHRREAVSRVIQCNVCVSQHSTTLSTLCWDRRLKCLLFLSSYASQVATH